MIEPASSPDSQTDSRLASAKKSRRRVWLFGSAVLLLLVLVAVPPFINISHFRRGIIRSISAGLGRPVYASAVELSLFPRPAFVLHNLTVAEDPAYGTEPMMMAGIVTASLRASTLWHVRVEIASLSFDAPSLNLVRNPQGKWSFESLLHNSPAIQSRNTPVARKRPPFPYVEATDARINFKFGPEKLPFSLEGADLAIWKESGDEWHARIQAHPVRTDLTVADAGQIRGEGVLKVGSVLKDSPIHANLEWRRVQLGEIGRLLQGEDDGWRGKVDWTAQARGTLGKILVTTNVGVQEFRRAEFVPPTEMDLTAQCHAQYLYDNKMQDSLQCETPLGDGRLLLHGRLGGTSRVGESGLDSLPESSDIDPSKSFQNRRILSQSPHHARRKTRLLNDGRVPKQPEAATIQIALQHASAGFFLGFLRHVHPGVAENAAVSGELNGEADCAWHGLNTLRACSGQVQSAVLTLALPHVAHSLQLSPFLLASSPATKRDAYNDSQSRQSASWSLAPVHVSLGGERPATITGAVNSTGATLNITGDADLAVVAKLAQVLKIPAISGELQSVRGDAQLAMSLESTWLPQPTADGDTDAQLGQFAPSRWNGTLQIHNAALQLVSLPGTVHLATAQVNFTPASAEWTNLRGTFAHVPFDGDLQWNTPCPTLKSACGRTFTLHTPDLDLTHLQTALRQDDRSSDLLNAINPWAAGPPELPRISGTLKADVLSAGRLSLNKAALELRLNGQSAQMVAISGHIFGGILSGIGNGTAMVNSSKETPSKSGAAENVTGSAQWGNGAPTYTLRVAFKGIQPDRVAAIWQEHWGSGSADARIGVKTHGWSADDLARSATGKFDISWTNGSLLAPLATLSPANATIAKFHRWSADGTIRNRTLTLAHSRMVLQNAGTEMGTSSPAMQTVSGTVRFGRELNLRLQPSSISIRGSLATPIVTPDAKSKTPKGQIANADKNASTDD